MLTEWRDAAKESKFWDKFIGVTVAAVLLMFMPYLHIGIYEKPGRETYKNVYFNSTANTFKIWVITILFIILFYESVKYLVSVYRTSKLRKIWFLLYLINLYPHYYSWWNIFGYYNDEFYPFLPQQVFFSMTEILSSAAVVYLCDAKHELKAIFLKLILAINTVHVLVSGSDQFVAHILRGQGTNFQNARNLGLMVPDLLHLIIPGLELYRREVQPSDRRDRKEIIMFPLLVAMGTVIGKIL